MLAGSAGPAPMIASVRFRRRLAHLDPVIPERAGRAEHQQNRNQPFCSVRCHRLDPPSPALRVILTCILPARFIFRPPRLLCCRVLVSLAPE